MKPPFAYFGSKGQMAPWISTLMPQHRVYVEPFAGSAAVMFAKAPSKHEVLNDVDGHVVRFMRLLRDRPADLERVCRLTPYARDEFALADVDDPEIDDLERARRWYVRSSQGFAQVATGLTGWSISVAQNTNPARATQNRIDRFAQLSRRLRQVVIEHDDALNVIRRYDAPDGVLYIDPPYLGSTRTSYRDLLRPLGDYRHEFESDDDHRALAEALRSTQGTVLLSGFPSPLYDDDLYADWHRCERQVLRRTSNGRSAAQTHMTEVVWSNRPFLDGQLPLVELTTAKG